MEPPRKVQRVAINSFDVVPLWSKIEEALKFLVASIENGRTDMAGSTLEEYTTNLFLETKKAVFASNVHSEAEQCIQVLFWDDCKKVLGGIYNSERGKVVGTLTLKDFYKCMIELMKLVMQKDESFWQTGKKPENLPFPEQVKQDSSWTSRDRSSCAHVRTWVCTSCQEKNPPDQFWCQRCWEERPTLKKDDALGPGDVWRWKNPPTKVHEGDGFWIFEKAAYWICDTPKDVRAFDFFEVRIKQSEGSFTKWLYEKFASQHPFIQKYDAWKGIYYGLLHRLDRETSGLVVVAKDEESYYNIKAVRDRGGWHKEYVCLIHGTIPVHTSEGVISTLLKTNEKNSADSGYTYIPEKYEWGAVQAESHYQVMKYYTRRDNRTGQQRTYTLVKVRIVTGKRHQIRVHMRHLSQEQMPENDGDHGIVSDFLYLPKWTSQADKTLCERVFLHERMLGFWDPENEGNVVCAVADLPQELEACLARLQNNSKAHEELKQHREILMQQDDVEAFANKYNIGPSEKRKLQEGDVWSRWPQQRVKLMAAFEKRAGNGLPTLSFKGDHSFLFQHVREHAEWMEGYDEAIEDAMKTQIDVRLMLQEQRRRHQRMEEAQSTDVVAPGWRKIVQKDAEGKKMDCYVHEPSGKAQFGRPCDGPPEDLPEGWEKVASSKKDGQPYYYNRDTQQSQFERPLPAGWKICKSRSHQEYYYNEKTQESQWNAPK